MQRYRAALQQADVSKATTDFSGTIEIIGGAGKLGQVFVHGLKSLGVVNVFEHSDWAQQKNRLQDAHIIIICVPVHKTIEVIQAQFPLAKNLYFS